MSLDLFLRSNMFLNPGFATGTAASDETKSEIVKQVQEIILTEEKAKAEQSGDNSNFKVLSGLNSRHLLAPALGDFLDRLFLLEPTDTKGFITKEEQELVDSVVKSKTIPALTDVYRDFSFTGNEKGLEYLLEAINKNDLSSDVKKFYDDALSNFRVVINEHGDYDSSTDHVNILLLGMMGEAREAFGADRDDLDKEIDGIRKEIAAREAENEGYMSFRKLTEEESDHYSINEVHVPLLAREDLRAKFPHDEFRSFNLADMKLLFELGILEKDLNIKSNWTDFDSLESKSIRAFCHYLGASRLDTSDLFDNLDYRNQAAKIKDLNYVIPKLDSSGLKERAQYLEKLADFTLQVLSDAESLPEEIKPELRSLLTTVKAKLEASQDSFYDIYKGLITDISSYLTA